ncbi:MAG: tRNA 2-thiouridine(34) synthase MnmA [Magnetococcales bacterium]|nr:tRNA 2-thiouridine(34) synthase MnmA [Magnetococcales bacterium]
MTRSLNRSSRAVDRGRRQRIVVAMSGGVDSSATAAWLLEQGHEVIGITMQLWDAGGTDSGQGHARRCCASDDLNDARRVADTLGIPFYVVNFEAEFRRQVVDDFIASYVAGYTPNPCIRCNQKLKFHHLLHKAHGLGADTLATGHYASRRITSSGVPQLWRATDAAKDQSYFLFTMTRQQLSCLLFPLGSLSKQQTRALAERHGLHVSHKRESQDICFIRGRDHGEFLRQQDGRLLQPGEVVDRSGKILGQHRGIACYTIGQRHGLGIAANRPLYVIELQPETNRVVVGPEQALYRQQMTLHDVNWLGDVWLDQPQSLMVQIRYGAAEQAALVEPLPDQRARVTFAQPQRGITAGQAAVFYQGQQLMGGGWIEKPQED